MSGGDIAFLVKTTDDSAGGVYMGHVDGKVQKQAYCFFS